MNSLHSACKAKFDVMMIDFIEYRSFQELFISFDNS